MCNMLKTFIFGGVFAVGLELYMSKGISKPDDTLEERSPAPITPVHMIQNNINRDI